MRRADVFVDALLLFVLCLVNCGIVVGEYKHQAIKLMLPLLQDVYLRAAVPFTENDFLEEPPAIPASAVSHSAASSSSKGSGSQGGEGHARSGSSELPAPRKLTNGEAKNVEKHFLKVNNICFHCNSHEFICFLHAPTGTSQTKTNDWSISCFLSSHCWSWFVAGCFCSTADVVDVVVAAATTADCLPACRD